MVKSIASQRQIVLEVDIDNNAVIPLEGDISVEKCIMYLQLYYSTMILH